MNKKGYSLVIISTIILAMAVLMIAVINYYDVSNIERKTKLTHNKFEQINIALTNYFAKNHKLPCPAPLDCDLKGCDHNNTYQYKKLGTEFRKDNNISEDCIADNFGVFSSTNEKGEKILYGNVPAFTLGLDTDFLADEWGNKIVYIISNSSTQEDALTEIIKSNNNNESNEYVKDGQLFILLSNNTDIAGAYPLNSRESNHFESTKIVRYTDENGEVIEVEQKVPNLPESNFMVSADDSNPLNYHKNILNMHPAFASVEADINNLTNYKCPPLNNFTYEIEIDKDGEEDEAYKCEEYDFTGQYQTFTVPEGVEEIYVELYGASGGNSQKNITKGGAGGLIAGNLDVKSGEKYYIYVGEKGVDGDDAYKSTPAWNGGGVAPTAESKIKAINGGGGGATDIRTSPSNSPTDWESSLDSRIMVAGGGGGAVATDVAGNNIGNGGNAPDSSNNYSCIMTLHGSTIPKFLLPYLANDFPDIVSKYDYKNQKYNMNETIKIEDKTKTISGLSNIINEYERYQTLLKQGLCPEGIFYNNPDHCNKANHYYVYISVEFTCYNSNVKISKNGIIFYGGDGSKIKNNAVGGLGGGKKTTYNHGEYLNSYEVRPYECNTLGGATYSGGGGYYAGCGTMCPNIIKNKIANINLYVGNPYNKLPQEEGKGKLYDFTCGGGGSGANYISNKFKELIISNDLSKHYGNGKAKICYTYKYKKPKVIKFTTNFPSAEPGKLSYSTMDCPNKVSFPVQKDDYYTVSSAFKEKVSVRFNVDIGCILISEIDEKHNPIYPNKTSIKCGANGEWETEIIDGKKQIKLYDRCMAINKCQVPQYVIDKMDTNFVPIENIVDGIIPCGYLPNGNFDNTFKLHKGYVCTNNIENRFMDVFIGRKNHNIYEEYLKNQGK